LWLLNFYFCYIIKEQEDDWGICFVLIRNPEPKTNLYLIRISIFIYIYISLLSQKKYFCYYCTLILPIDQSARALHRRRYLPLDRLCTVLASVLHLDSPQEPAKDRTAPLRPIALRRSSQRLNHQNTKRKTKNFRNRAMFSLSVL